MPQHTKHLRGENGSDERYVTKDFKNENPFTLKDAHSRRGNKRHQDKPKQEPPGTDEHDTQLGANAGSNGQDVMRCVRVMSHERHCSHESESGDGQESYKLEDGAIQRVEQCRTYTKGHRPDEERPHELITFGEVKHHVRYRRR